MSDEYESGVPITQPLRFSKMEPATWRNNIQIS